MKYFDTLQKIIIVSAIATLVLAIVFQVFTVSGATPIYDEKGALESYQYPVVFQTLFSIFVFLHIASFTWFIARSITYKMRLKEEKDEQEGY